MIKNMIDKIYKKNKGLLKALEYYNIKYELLEKKYITFKDKMFNKIGFYNDNDSDNYDNEN